MVPVLLPSLSGVDWNLPPVDGLQLAVGAGIVVLALVLGRVVRAALQRYHSWRGRSPSYAEVFARLGGWTVGLLGTGIGLTVAFPSVDPVDVLGGLGILSIAAGIAFQDVLSNLFAGVLMLTRETFRSGDQIAIGDVRGTVERITLRETVVRTFDGRRVLIPNSTVHNGVVTVQTGYEQVRTSVVIGVAYEADLDEARQVALAAMDGLPQVAEQPAPQALIASLGASTVDIELRFWSGARQLETREALDAVIAAVVRAYEGVGIEMPADIRVLQSSPSFTAALAQAGRGEPAEPPRRRTRRAAQSSPFS